MNNTTHTAGNIPSGKTVTTEIVLTYGCGASDEIVAACHVAARSRGLGHGGESIKTAIVECIRPNRFVAGGLEGKALLLVTIPATRKTPERFVSTWIRAELCSDGRWHAAGKP